MTQPFDTLDYARTMMEYGRYDVARRSLDPIADEPEARALIDELDGLIRARGNDPNALRMVIFRPLTEAVARVRALDRGPAVFAPRWQRRYVVEVVAARDDRAVVRVRSRAVSPYEFRFVPAKARLELDQLEAGRTHIDLSAAVNRSYFVLTVLGAVSLIYLTLFFTLRDLSAACLIMFPVTFFTFYMVPTMMEHAKTVRDDLLDNIRAALTDDLPPDVLPLAAPVPQVLGMPVAAAQAALLGLDGQLTRAAASWPSRVVVRHEATTDGLRFRVQANPILFYHWALMPPTIQGDLYPASDGTSITLTPTRRNDLLWLWVAGVFLLIVVGALLAQAGLAVRLLILALSAAALAANYAIAQLSMDARGAVLAHFVLDRLTQATPTDAEGG